MARVLLIDGLAVRTTLDLAGVPRTSRPADWDLRITDSPLLLDDDATEWTGDIRDDAGPWARFGRLGEEHRVHLAGVGDLCASLSSRRATLHPASPAVRPTGAFRRLVPYLAALDGRLALHASCAVFPQGAALFCAASGTGKSTLALALDAAGFAVLADDHVVVEAHGPDQVAHASFPFVEADGTACAVLRPERMPHEDKAPLPLLTPRPAAPQPVVCVAFLERGAELAVEPLPSAEAARRLLRDVLFVADPGSPSENAGRLDGAVALARDLPTIRLTLPDGLQRLASGLSALPALLPAR